MPHTDKSGGLLPGLACKRRGSNRRRDGLHQLSRRLVNAYGLVFEDLRIASMTRSARGTLEQPGSQVAQKAGLNREILAASWGALISMVAYKAEDAGRELIMVNPRGHQPALLVLRAHGSGEPPLAGGLLLPFVRVQDHADVNAARNILWLGLSLRRQRREAETGAA